MLLDVNLLFQGTHYAPPGYGGVPQGVGVGTGPAMSVGPAMGTMASGGNPMGTRALSPEMGPAGGVGGHGGHDPRERLTPPGVQPAGSKSRSSHSPSRRHHTDRGEPMQLL